MRASMLFGIFVAVALLVTVPPMLMMRANARESRAAFAKDLKEIQAVQEVQGRLLKKLEVRLADGADGGGGGGGAVKKEVPDSNCVDLHDGCPRWANCCPNGSGILDDGSECSKEDCSDPTIRACEGGFMSSGCKATCGLCPGQKIRFATSQFEKRGPVTAIYERLGVGEGAVEGHPGVRWERFHSVNPKVVYLKNVLTDAECTSLKKRAEPRLARSRTVDHKENQKRKDIKDGVDQARTSQGMWIGEKIPERSQIEEVVSTVTGFSRDNFEQLQILRYTGGEFYKPHTDYFDRSMLQALGKAGNRVATAIVFLNTIPAGHGGETKFPFAEPEPVKVTPKAGDGIVFYDMMNNIDPDPLSTHEAVPPADGYEKWVAITWVRLGSFF